MDNHGARPEILAAGENGYGSAVRHSATLERDFLYVAQRIGKASGTTLYLRLAEPLAASEVLRHRLTLSVLLSSLAALIVMAIISLWLDRELFKPLARLVEGAHQLATGDLDKRVEVPDSEEIAALARTINQLAERVQDQVESAASQRERLQLISDSMPDGIVVTDREARVRTVNPALRRLFKVRGEVEGRSIRDLTGIPQIEKALKKALKKGTSRALEVEVPGPRLRTLSVTSSALEDRSGGIVAIHDISEFLLLGKIRRDLVANVSHELKTPLTAIRGYTETLLDSALEDRETSRLFSERILEQCSRLEALLGDLLTLSRLERDEKERELQKVDLKRVVEEAAQVLEATARNREVDVLLALDEVVLDGDYEALAELCLNLIDNAIKYNRAGGSVAVRLSRAAGWTDLEVRDTGRGIPREAIPRIFERFYRVDRGRSRSEGGTGLGLSIVKHAVERHGGTVTVESALSKGSSFRVRLPISPQEPN
jgi:two-component system phosphate regulon sensor histidine kinase PhoR